MRAEKQDCLVAIPPTGRTRGGWAFFIVLMVVAGGWLIASCSSEDGETGEGEAEPTCSEARLATGTGFPWDPGLALAISRQIEVTHPELGGLIDAAADYQQAHPTYQDFERPRRDDQWGEGTTGYLAALLVLAERADLATPEALEVLRQAASEGGMLEVGRVIDSSDSLDPRSPGAEALNILRALVSEREEAAEDAGIVSLPDQRCPPEGGRDG